MHKLLIVSLLTVFSSLVSAQKMLLLEKAGRAKTTRIYVGETIRFKLRGQPGWYSRTLTDVLPAEKSVLLGQEIIPIEDISHLKRPRNRVLRMLGGQLLVFSATLTLAAGASLIDHEKPKAFWLPIGLVSTAGGLLLVKNKIIKLGKKRRLRAIDLTWERPRV